MPLIAITREMGSCGTEIAAKVANALSIPLVHHEIPDRVASRWAVRREVVLDLKAARPTRFNGFRALAHRNAAYVSAEVLSIAAARSVVFRGWGAAQMFYKVPHALSVHVGAPFKVRLARMLERTSLEKRLVKNIVRENDEIRAQLAREYYGRDWCDPDGYDLAINTGRSSVDDAVEQILTLARSPTFQETPKSTRALENLRLEALARATLYSNPVTRDLHIHIKASEEELVLGGIVDDGDQREEIIRTLSNISRGISITSRLRAPTDYYTRTSSI
jgi:cytidylate kinase